jgi:membrane-bound lytic murein transglycosylase D
MKITHMLTYMTMAFALLLTPVILLNPCPCSAQGRDIPMVPVVTDFLLPKTMTLCEEPVPLENRWVWEMLDRELTISAWDRAQVFMWLKRAGRYFPYIEKRLSEAGMPRDLKYLPVAESSLLTHISSTKGAIGPWQFLAGTARRNGLRKDRRMDERRDFELATEAALKYLRRLHETFGTWTLALAAYNCGGARLKKELNEQKVTDYYTLNLPTETERFVYRIAAIKLIMENPGLYGYRVPNEKIYGPVPHDAVKVSVKVPIHLTDLSKALGTNLKAIKDLNPQIIGYYLPEGKYVLKTPQGTGHKVNPNLKELARKATPPPAKVSGNYYVVRPGDNLTRISKKTGVSLSKLKRMNKMDGSLIKVGQKLRIKP